MWFCYLLRFPLSVARNVLGFSTRILWRCFQVGEFLNSMFLRGWTNVSFLQFVFVYLTVFSLAKDSNLIWYHFAICSFRLPPYYVLSRCFNKYWKSSLCRFSTPPCTTLSAGWKTKWRLAYVKALQYERPAHHPARRCISLVSTTLSRNANK